MLTLIVVPVAYTYFDDFGNWVVRLVKREKRGARAGRRAVGEHGAIPQPAGD